MPVAVVVGYGSIGRRHVRLLRQLGCSVVVVSRRLLNDVQCFPTVAAALAAVPADYAVVANETSRHRETVDELAAAKFSGTVLIEKPLGGTDFPTAAFALAAVGYNLRFHSVLHQLRGHLRCERIVAMQVYCGQFLPDWRPDADYRKVYSADVRRGGGVLRDLSHELDYILWIGGGWHRVAALGGHFSKLEIDSDDSWGLLIELDRCQIVTVQINYLDRPGRRQLVVNTEQHTYIADLILATLTCDGQTQQFSVDHDDTYLAQHRAMLMGDPSQLCSVAEGERVMDLIAAAEQAVCSGEWVRA